MENQPLSRIALFIKLLFISVSLLLLSAIFIVFSFDYESFVNFVLMRYGMPEKTAQLKEEYLTPATFLYIRYGLLVLTLIVIVSFLLLRNKISSMALGIYESFSQFMAILKGIGQQLNELSGTEKFILACFFVLLAGLRIFYLFKYPLVNDEVYSYLYFVDKGFLAAASYYPAPNSHIFFSELCVLTDIFFNDPPIVMRLPSLIAGLLTSFLLFIVVKKKFGFETALIAMAIFSFSYNIFYYSIHGRGYTLLSLFVLISWVSVLNFIAVDSKRIYKVLFAISSILGFYTIPVYLYPYASLVVLGFGYFLLNKQFKEAKKFFILNAIIGVVVLLVYSPVFLLSGINSVIGNKWVTALSSELFWNSIAVYFINAANYLWDIEKGGLILMLIVLVSGTFVLLRKKELPLAVSILLLTVLPVLFLFIQNLQPFFRVWDYFMVFLSLLIAVCLKELIDLIRIQKFRSIAVTIIALFIFLFHVNVVRSDVQRGFPYYTQLHVFLDQLFLDNIKSVYVPDDTYKLFIEFRAHELDKTMELSFEALNSPEVIVVAKGGNFPSGIDITEYKPYFSNEYIQSYRKK